MRHVARIAFQKAPAERSGDSRLVRDRNIIAVKRAYGAVRNIVTVFDSSITRVPRRVSSPEMSLQLWEFARRGQPLFVFWTHGHMAPKTDWTKVKPDDLVLDRPSDSFATRPIVIDWRGAAFENPVWVDLLTGRVYAFPKEDMLVHSAGVTFVNVPVYDSPCVLTERAALNINL